MRALLRVSWPYFLGFAVLTILCADHCFFWDTLLQASRYAHFYCDIGIPEMQLLVPEQMDAGHPPFFGFYLGLLWSTFGKSLWMSHLAMLPFLFGIVWMAYRLLEFFVPTEYLWLGMLLLLTNTVLLGQAVLVSPDIPLLFCFLLVLHGIYHRIPWQMTVGALGVGLLSIRGLMLLAALTLIALGVQCMEDKRSMALFQKIKPLIPALLIVFAWYTFHHWHTGWWFSTPSDSWEGQREVLGVAGIGRNVVIFGWRLIDLGMLGWWLVLGWLFYRGRNEETVSACNLPLVVPFILIFILGVPMLLVSNPIGHRYLLPIYLTLSLSIFTWMTLRFDKKVIYRVSIFLLIVQLSGHFWVYPRTIAKGWDSSLAHLPYYQLREQVLDYLNSENITPADVGTAFPNIGERHIIDLKEGEGFMEKNLPGHRYIWYSNIFNDFTDVDFATLEKEYRIKQRWQSVQVEMILYERVVR